MFIRFDMIHERDRRRDGRTPHADIGRAYASHRAAKNDALYGLGRSTTVEDVIFQDQVQDLDLRVRSKLKRAFVPALIQASS